MDEEQLKKIRRTPGTNELGGATECSLTGWYVNNKTGEIHPLGVLAYGSKSPWKRMKYRILRRLGRI